jgi:enoyl-CoA hydratase
MSDILARVEGRVGHLTLNRPAAINALTRPMVSLIDQALTDWAADANVEIILFDGAGERGFCAGGDIRALYYASKAGTFEINEEFFAAEYRLNCRIARFAKPIVAFMDGMVMGGGIGLGGHAANRIVTERSVLAMPETRIGFVPDVGGTYLLGMAPGELGTHAGLTAGRLSGADAIAIGMADAFVPSSRLDELRAALFALSSAKELPATLALFKADPGESKLLANAGWINRCYAGNRAEDILASLRAAAEPEAQKAASEISLNSPTSIKVTLEALRRARALGRLEECLDQEYRMVSASIRTADFVEGVRAAVVDKDRNPKWSPDRLEDVAAAVVEAHFRNRGGEELGLGKTQA